MKEYETAVVLGLGASGEAAARLLLAEGTRVTCLDRGESPPLAAVAKELTVEGAEVLLGCGEVPDRAFSVAVVSPGVPVRSPWVQQLERLGVRRLSELELGWSRWTGRVLAVTGSNGKSTMVKLCRDALCEAGVAAAIAGNYGPPVCRVAREASPAGWLVIEVSSFQLEHVERFRPDVGVLLNVFPNHLDRHGTAAEYFRIKRRLFDRMNAGDAAVVSDEVLARWPSKADGLNRWLSFGASPQADYRFESGSVIRSPAAIRGLDAPGNESISFANTIFDNDVLGLTAAAAVAAMDACGVDVRRVGEAARRFEALPHRMQEVAVVKGVRFVDNSKGTNLAALAASLRMVREPVRLIAGGLLKEGDLESVKQLLSKRVRGAYLIGKASETMRSAWAQVIPCHMCADLRGAVSSAWSDAAEGDVVLLSPGCASFDQFANFEDRGNQFHQMVKSIEKEQERVT